HASHLHVDTATHLVHFSLTRRHPSAPLVPYTTLFRSTLASGKHLDAETATQHVLTVTASDGTLTDTATVTVTVTDVNDNAPAFDAHDYPPTESEDIASASSVSTLHADDLDVDSANNTV